MDGLLCNHKQGGMHLKDILAQKFHLAENLKKQAIIQLFSSIA